MAASAGTDLDRYQTYYTAKLWKLLPAVYRAEDGEVDRHGPLAELVARLGAQAAVLRRSIDRLWEDQSIETCDDWVIAYLGDLLATNLVTRLDARGQRVDVAKTIYYRRRKGTVALLEELAKDITGWSARVVEFSRRLARTRHALDPAIGLPVDEDDPRFPLQRAEGLIGARTLTGAGGLADLRNALGAAWTSTAFDEYFHTADVRRGRGKTGWHNIPRVGVFVWRQKSLFVQKVTPVAAVGCGPNFRQFTFDPTGRDIPLYGPVERPLGDQWVSPTPQQMPGPLSADLLAAAFTDLYPSALGIYNLPGPDYGLFAPADVVLDPRVLVKMPQPQDPKPWVDPGRGRVFWRGRPNDFVVDYRYGLAAEIGAGPYDRPALPTPAVQPSSSFRIENPGRTITAGTSTEIVIGNSLTYTNVADVGAIAQLIVRAGSQQRPLIRPPQAVLGWRLTGLPQAQLTLDGIFLSGCDLVLLGEFDKVTLSCCTLDPGTWDPDRKDAHENPAPGWRDAADGRRLAPTQFRIEGNVRELVIDRSITGPILTAGSGLVEKVTIRESIVQAAEPTAGALALSLADADATLSRSTILGGARLHRLEASECILHDVVEVSDRQQGCVRFSAWAEGSRIPRQYESVMVPVRASLFASLHFGRPEYAQLLDTAGGAIVAGAEDGSEMGAFWREKAALKERALLIKYQEFLPLGLEPVVIHVT